MSLRSDQVSMYSRSMRTQSSKPISLRPLTCHRQVSPGRIERRRRSKVRYSATSPGPVFFEQVRCGKRGRPFGMYKLRSMTVDAEEKKAELMDQNEMDGPVFKMKHDPRITPVGRFIRRWSIDEIPQFWNVLRGDMSLVGPRPPVPMEVVEYATFQRRRLSMRPGITCLWQVSGRNEIGFEDWVRMDLEYIDTWSVLSDVKILLRTIPATLSGSGR